MTKKLFRFFKEFFTASCYNIEQNSRKELTTATSLENTENTLKIRQSEENLKQNSPNLVKSTISLTATSGESENLNSISTIEEFLRPTVILQPLESQSYKVEFFPDKIGKYEEKYSLTIANSLEKTYTIYVEGRSDIPRINTDPSIIFRKV